MTSCRTERVLSFILSNSSMQQTPLSLNTNAPLHNNNYNCCNYYNYTSEPALHYTTTTTTAATTTSTLQNQQSTTKQQPHDNSISFQAE